MKGSLSIGRVLGVPLRLHYTWFIIFGLVVISLIAFFPGYSLWQRISLGILGSILFFASIIAHELAHSIVAIRNNIPVKSITLFVFGGVAQITREATRPVTELLIAVVGPLCSLMVAGIFYSFSLLLAGAGLAVELFQLLAVFNLVLALFNLIPGLPLDGGRVFRAIVWRGTGSYIKATRVASLVGRAVAYLLIVGGIAGAFITRDWLSGLWLVLIGWFLENAARASYQQALLRDALAGFSARDVMGSECPVVSGQLSLGELVRDHILSRGHSYIAVVDRGKLEGIVTLRNVKAVARSRWDVTLVAEIMTPVDRLKIAHPGQDVLSLLQQMDEVGIDQMPVVESGRVIGMVARDSLIRFWRTRAELGM